MAIRLIITGGTIDKEYDEIKEMFAFKESHLSQFLKQARIQVDVVPEVLMLIDSLDMRDEHREKILKACQDSPEDKIIIVHGTGTMTVTAEFVMDKLKDKTVVFTGAMVPGVVSNTDAFFNLGTAFAFVQSLPKGVYLAINGRKFEAGKVMKNTVTGCFEELL